MKQYQSVSSHSFSFSGQCYTGAGYGRIEKLSRKRPLRKLLESGKQILSNTLLIIGVGGGTLAAIYLFMVQLATYGW